MKKILLIGLSLVLGGSLSGRDFTVLVYNVENLFDLDGVALYSDYDPAAGSAYGIGPLLNKFEGIRTVLAEFNEGIGPEVVLFQEFELDRTPFDTPSAEAFLNANQDESLETLLRKDRTAARLPVELLLLKFLEDHGLEGYQIAQPDPLKMESHAPHKNVVFSRFPIQSVRQRPMLKARDLLVTTLDVDGHELVLLNNHWKSGASDAQTEPIRVQNARVVRAEVEAILFNNPQADVIIGGDLNAYYNHKAAFPDLEETAVNDVLRANGYEDAMLQPNSRNLYNLWFELPPEERGSEVYQGRWGTLMQMILTPGLYDEQGIQYIDNSFNRLLIPGENVDTRWGRPISWSNVGGGAGYSDHLPIYARFQVVPGEGSAGAMAVQAPTREELGDFRLAVPFERLDRRAVPSFQVLGEWTDAERVQQIGELFLINTTVVAENPTRIAAGDYPISIYSPVRSIRNMLNALKLGDRVHAYADLDDWRGTLQLVIRDPSWMLETSGASD